MPTLKRLCPSCRRVLIATGKRCSACEQAYNQQRGSATARGLGVEYQRNRAIVLAASRVCWICGQPGADTADHVVSRADGGDSSIANLRPAHRSCNSARGAR